MHPRKFIPPVLTCLLLIILACGLPAPAPNQADPNAFNTMVAQTALARPTLPPPPTLIPPAAAPTLPPPPTLAPTIPPTAAGPSVLVSATVNLPRHTALDLETKAVSGILADMTLINNKQPDLSRYYQKAPPGADFVFYAPNPTTTEWQFLNPVNGVRLVAHEWKFISQPTYNECVQSFREITEFFNQEKGFPLDSWTFDKQSRGFGKYHCFTTDKGNLGALKLTAPGDYGTMAYVIIEYTLWDARLP